MKFSSDEPKEESGPKEWLEKEIPGKETPEQKGFDKEKIAAWVVRYQRQVAVGLIVLVLIIVAIAGSLGGSGADETAVLEDGTEETALTEETGGDGTDGDAGETAAEEDDNPLEKDAYPEVNELITKYYDYIAAGDVEGLSSVEDEVDEEEQERILRSTDLVEGYQNISCYTKKGLEDGSYLVFAYYELKFYQIDTAAPGISPFYVYTNDEGSLVIFNGEASDELNAYVQEMAAEEDVIALMADVSEAYAAAKEADSNLEELEERYLRIAEDSSTDDSDTEDDADTSEDTDDSGDADETGETDTDETDDADSTDSESEDDSSATADTGEATEQNRETRFTESVRLRSEPSTDGEYLGTAYMGESVTQIESYESGWSKIEYNGTECYCMTEYLE